MKILAKYNDRTMILNPCPKENFKAKEFTHDRNLRSMDSVLSLMIDLITIECGFNPPVLCCTEFED